jgi:hypothetical protein
LLYAHGPKTGLAILIALVLAVAGSPGALSAPSAADSGSCCADGHGDAPAPEDPGCCPDGCASCGLSCCGKSLFPGLRIEPRSLEELSGRAEAAAPAAPRPAPSRGIDRPPRT